MSRGRETMDLAALYWMYKTVKVARQYKTEEQQYKADLRDCMKNVARCNNSGKLSFYVSTNIQAITGVITLMKQVECVCRLRRDAEIKAFLYECNVYFIYGFYDAFFAKYTYASTLFFSIRELRIMCGDLPKSALLNSNFILPRKRNLYSKAKKILRKNRGL